MKHGAQHYNNYGSLQTYNSGKNRDVIINFSSNKNLIFSSPSQSSSHHGMGISDIIRGYSGMGYSNNGFDAELNTFSH
jgi:hypothetical protein